MAVIGNRIKQVLRILHTDGPCTSREIFDRMDGALNDLAEVSKYVFRARKLGLVTSIDERPAIHAITEAGVSLVGPERVAGVHKRAEHRAPRGPSSVWDYAARAA